MPCAPEMLKKVPLFALLDQDEAALLADQVEMKSFQPRQRIYKMGDPGKGYVIVDGHVRVTMIDEDNQEVVIDEPGPGEFFGFASMLQQKEHHTEAVALEALTCIEVDQKDILILLAQKPHAGIDMLSVLGKQFHVAQQLVRVRANRHPNEIIDEHETLGERIADSVASFGGSWTFIIVFAVILSTWTAINVILRGRAWDPYPFILLNLFLSMLAAIQAPVIMMSQNRQDKKDRLRSELDYDVNRRAHTEIQGLAHKINLLGDRLGDVEDLLRAASARTQS
jgi:CRP/FNR family transcriptional regulator, cyclic AMP receptor protein